MAKVTLTFEDDDNDSGVLVQSHSTSDPNSEYTYAEMLMSKVIEQLMQWFPGMEITKPFGKDNAKA